MKNIKITWINRYSDTLQDDDMGRWGITANVGDFSKVLTHNYPTTAELGWIKKVYVATKTHFIFHPNFPFKSKPVYKTVEECKQDVEDQFNHFIKIATQSF